MEKSSIEKDQEQILALMKTATSEQLRRMLVGLRYIAKLSTEETTVFVEKVKSEEFNWNEFLESQKDQSPFQGVV